MTIQQKNDIELNKEVSPNQVKLSIESESFRNILISNFSALSPLCSLSHASIFTPIIFTSWVFVYTILNIFGLYALYFNETMIESQINKEIISDI